MSTQVQLRRGTGAAHATFTGALAEPTFDTSAVTIRIHDGVTAGGWLMATQAWVASQILAGVADGSLTPTKFANIAQNQILGRIAVGSGAPSWLDSTSARQAIGATTIGSAMIIATDQRAALGAIGQRGLNLFRLRSFR